MPNASVTLIGTKQLREAFSRQTKATQRGQLVTAAKAGILPIQNEAILLAPKKESNLARSIHTEVTQETDTYAEVFTGTDVEYARRRELGFSDIDSLGRHYNDPPQAYMRPAYDNKQNEARKEVADVLRILIESAV